MATKITETLTIKIDCSCKKNPVYLTWQGTNGGYNYWLFHEVQSEAEEDSIAGEFAPYIADLENALGNAEVITKDSKPQLTVGAYLDAEDLTAGVNPKNRPQLKGLLRSPNVFMLMNPDTWKTESPKWMRVRVAPQTFKIIDTNQSKAQIELTLLMPTVNIQSQ